MDSDTLVRFLTLIGWLFACFMSFQWGYVRGGNASLHAYNEKLDGLLKRVRGGDDGK